jgi:NAD(P)-dependent dehydrogenase (short-subunit alcohol dehydrogenase family)
MRGDLNQGRAFWNVPDHDRPYAFPSIRGPDVEKYGDNGHFTADRHSRGPDAVGPQSFRHVMVHQDGAIPDKVRDPPSDPGAAQRLGAAAIEDRVAVVTGGNRGLGLALVRALAQRGTRVVMATRSLDRGWAALDLLGDLADRVAVRQLDVTDQSSVTRLTSWAERQLGRCDVLMNNAAVLIDDERGSSDVDLDIVRRTLETNLLGTWRVSQAVAPLMRRHHYGRIVNISSSLGRLSSMGPGLPAYRVSQTSISALTRMLACDLADDGILVNACCPGSPDVSISGGRSAVQFTPSADTALWLATLPDDGPTGLFFRDGKAIEW